VIWWADDAHDAVIARTMGLTTFAIANVFFSFCVKDDLRSVFDVETFADRRLLKMTALSGLAILFGTELRILQHILHTVSLTGRQWVICILAALTIVAASEIQKLVRRRQVAESGETTAEEAPAAAAVGPTTP
jgi:Ca2+-transporting ATPase